MAEGWDLVAEQRNAFADLIEPLDDEQAATPSLCEGWTVHETAAHLLTFTHLGMTKFAWEMAKSRFNYDRGADRIARRLAGKYTLEEIAEKLHARADSANVSKQFPPEMTTTDVTIHMQDVRRPLDLGTDVDPDIVTTVLDFLTTHKQGKAVVSKGRLDGLALSATDADWSHGTGAEVSGPGEALMMAIAGRPTFDELSGDGVELLADRP
jgi:uncharacterized protein (TIGR03083 family)